MSIRRIVPDITSGDFDACRDFYGEFLGMELAMDMGWILTFVSPLNPKAQVTLLKKSEKGVPNPDISIEVEDVDSVYSSAIERGLEIVYPITDEPWGVRRFFVTDPNGRIINVVEHRKA